MSPAISTTDVSTTPNIAIKFQLAVIDEHSQTEVNKAKMTICMHTKTKSSTCRIFLPRVELLTQW